MNYSHAKPKLRASGRLPDVDALHALGDVAMRVLESSQVLIIARAGQGIRVTAAVDVGQPGQQLTVTKATLPEALAAIAEGLGLPWRRKNPAPLWNPVAAAASI